MSNREEMECVVQENKPDLVFITETWASENVGEGELSLDGLDFMRNGRKRRGGGCFIYVKVDLKAIMLWELTHVEDIDTVWCRVCDATLEVCYNTTTNSQEQQKNLQELLEVACRMKEDNVICGDFNHRTID